MGAALDLADEDDVVALVVAAAVETLEDGSRAGEQGRPAGPPLPGDAGETIDLLAREALRQGVLAGRQDVDGVMGATREGRQSSRPWRDKLHNTSGGSIETELNELAVRPTGAPSSSSAVTMVTPVAKVARAARKIVATEGGRAGEGRGGHAAIVGMSAGAGAPGSS